MRALLIIVSVCALHHAAAGQSFRTDHGTVSYTSSVPLHTWTGTSDRLVGRISLADSTVDFYVDLSTIDSGIGKRDRDMRLTLDTKQFPFAEFFGRLTSLPKPGAIGPQTMRVVGTFKVHGEARNVTVDGTLERAGSGLHIVAQWELNLADYAIEPPSLLMVRVADTQQIRIDALLQPE